MVRDIMLKSTFYKLKEKKAETEKKLIEMPGRIKQAVEEGRNFCENGSWEDILEEKKSLEWELSELNYHLKNAFFIENLSVSENGKIEIGKEIKLRNVKTEKIEKYKIIGSTDAIYCPNLEKNGTYLVSYDSPVGSCLIGRNVGEKINIKLPRESRTLEILEVKPLS